MASIRRIGRKELIGCLITLGFLCALLSPSRPFAFTLNVVDGSGAPITGGYRWLLEEDNTNVTVYGAQVANSISVDLHKSHAPVLVKGDSNTASTTVNVPNTQRYFVSVLPNSGYALGGTVVAVGQNAVTVTVHRLPLPTAQISILVFKDHNPVNNAPDAEETGLAHFTIKIFDQGGEMSQDVFGNPLGTTYQQYPTGEFILGPDGNPLIAGLGTGVILTDANGNATIKYIAPGKYGIRAVPPTVGPNWIQTATIEGTPGVDAWVKVKEPSTFIEGFGVGFKHVFIGFVNLEEFPWAVTPPGGTGTIKGQLVFNHFSRPPFNQGFFPGLPVPECYIGLNDLAAVNKGLVAVPCDGNSNFEIPNVPPGTYQLVWWDKPLDALFGFSSVTVPPAGGVVDLGKVLAFRWFGTLDGSVFLDSNENGIRDPGETGIMEQVVNIRFRDGSLYQTTVTDPSGEYGFAEVFPFFKWLVTEVDFARLKATGMTTVVDNGGPLKPMPIYPYATKNAPQPQPENGNLGWRTETGPVLTQAMHLFLNQLNIIDWGKNIYPPGENGGISGVVYYATTRAEPDPRLAVAEPWEPGIPRVQVALYRDSNNDGVIDDINGTPGIQLADVDNHPLGWSTGGPKGPEDIDRNNNGVFDTGDALDVTWTDSWDDTKPTGCIQTLPVIHGQTVNECYDNYGTWNQVRPGVFDGGYAFGPNLSPGTYIVHAVPPPGYEIVKEEDKNVDFGESYVPSPLAVPWPCVGNTANTLEPQHVVPPFLQLFPDQEIPAPNAGLATPLCHMRQVNVVNIQNSAADFFLFTEVPKAARVVGFVNNDLAAEFDTTSPVFGEKASPKWIPISFQDWTGKEIVRVYADEFGSYNALLPSTYTMNIPAPSGASPNMITVVLNYPLDPNYNPNYAVVPWTFDFWPGKTTYLDTPIVPVAAFATFPPGVLDVGPEAGTPVINSVVNAAEGGPLVCSTGGNISITSLGIDPATGRDIGFGATTGTVTVDGTPITVNTWSNTLITAAVSGGATGQLMITRGDNGKTTEIGVTLHIVNCAATVRRPVIPAAYPATPIQNAIDAASPNDIILVAPGSYPENPILYKKVKLQGSGAGTVINANPSPTDRTTVWHARIVSILGNDPFANGANETPGIMVLGNAGFVQTNFALIDGFTIVGAVQGGGIYVNRDANYLQISNNKLMNNQGNYSGGITLGTPGLSSNNTNITIQYNRVVNNGGVQGGGGISIYSGAGSYRILNNIISGNFSRFNGAGIDHSGLSSNGLIEENKILFNEVFYGLLLAGAGDAGGIFVGGEAAVVPGGVGSGSGNVTINANLLQGNLTGSGFGGGIRALGVNGQDVVDNPGNPANWYGLNIFNNILVNNVAGHAGGGIALQDVAKAQIINNTIAKNDSTATAAGAFTAGQLDSNPQGAGIVSNVHSLALQAPSGQEFSNPVLRNNILWQNRSFFNNHLLHGGAGGLSPSPAMPYWDLQVTGTATPQFLDPENCILSTLTDGAHSYAGNGNLASNPDFLAEYFNALQSATVADEGGNSISVRFTPLAPAGNYHLQAGSPAIGGGQGITGPELSADFDGQTRPNGGSVDIGADEFYAGGTFFQITAAAGAGGNIAPVGTALVLSGTSQSFTLTPEFCYEITDVVVDGASVCAPNCQTQTSYTFTNVTGDHTVSATFARKSLTVTSEANAGGTISPPGATVVHCGDNQSYTITAAPGFFIIDLFIDFVSIGNITDPAVMNYDFTHITGNHTIRALFGSTTGAFTIASSAGPGGTVTPPGASAYDLDGSAVYTITPDLGYRIVDVLVDENSVLSALVPGPGNSQTYAFNNITANHTLSATFVIEGLFLITASANAGGTVDPVGGISLLPGSNQGFFITPNPGFRIADVLVDGVSHGAITFYLFSNVQADHTIAVTFVSDITQLIQSYYLNILDRSAEQAGLDFWVSEINRIEGLGIDIKEGFIAVGKAFFNSAEYLGKGETDNAYILDLYRTFLNRTPVQPEIDFHLNSLAQGVSRNLVLNNFIFSLEFKAFMEGIFGVSTPRPENTLVNDFYRGILSRLPDTAGFNYWLGQMRTAQCTGAQAVRDLSNQIALGFIQSAEYLALGRTDGQFVEDLYDAVLRRAASPAEGSYWLGVLGTATREQVLQQFTDSPEFQTRVQAVIDAGCLP